ncbi:hypothetical protein WDW37_11540 [Bdellovibrionota bacterium FG-1]
MIGRGETQKVLLLGACLLTVLPLSRPCSAEEIPPTAPSPPSIESAATPPEPTPEAVVEAPPAPPPPPAVEEAQKIELPKSEPTENDVESTTVEHRNSRVPAYTITRPAWGIQFTGALKAFGGNDFIAAQAGVPTRAFQVSGEYLFPFLQSIGVLSLGPTVGTYPIFGSITSNAVSVFEVGGQVRYQFRFFREQPIVPIAGFQFEYLSYRFTYPSPSGMSGALMATGPSFGGMLLLNWLEPSAAAESYVENGISRSYLLAELRSLSGTDANLSLSGMSLFFGLRLEL